MNKDALSILIILGVIVVICFKKAIEILTDIKTVHKEDK
jgi:hypothetical protein